MSINFIPNDPQVTPLDIRVISPRPDRPTGRAGFNYFGQQPEDIYDPATQTAGFIFWQCREAALAALDAWEDVSGRPLTTWQPGTKIGLRPDHGVDLNAFYDRNSLSFFHFANGNKTFLSGGSTDVVAHEAGHGILDATRPEFWFTAMYEVNSFHEAFGDCVAIIAALFDRTTRKSVLASLSERNFVESTAENLAAGIKSVQPNHNAALPRRASNNFKWQLPSTLPDFGSSGDGPGKLINEIHSFGQVFSGCFYDTIVGIFNATNGSTEAQLLTAVRTAGRLLARAIATAPPKARFFREVGRAMVKADEQDNAGANRDAIKAAFETHDLPLGTGAMLAPTSGLAGTAPKIAAGKASLAAATKQDIRARIGADGGRLSMSPLRIGGESVVEVKHERLVPLDSLDKRLKGVVARASEPVLVGRSGGRAAVLGALPQATGTAEEVETFVRSLLDQDAIKFDGQPRRAATARAVATAKPKVDPVTHTIKTVSGKKVLTRIRFACGCCGKVVGS